MRYTKNCAIFWPILCMTLCQQLTAHSYAHKLSNCTTQP